MLTVLLQAVVQLLKVVALQPSAQKASWQLQLFVNNVLYAYADLLVQAASAAQTMRRLVVGEAERSVPILCCRTPQQEQE